MKTDFDNLVFNETPDAIIVATPDGTVAYWNRGAEAAFGYASVEAIGRLVNEMIVPPDRSRLSGRFFSKRLKTDPQRRNPFRSRKGGSLVYVDVSSKVVRDQEGQIEVSPQGYVVSWNKGAERIKGYKVDEIIGKYFSCFYPPEANAQGKPEHDLRTAVEQGHTNEEGWRVRKDGQKFWAYVVITAIFAKDGCLQGFAKIMRDMTERERSVRALYDKNTELAEARSRQALIQSEQAIRVSELNCRRSFEAAQELDRLQEHRYVRYEGLPLETRDSRRITVEFVSSIYQVSDRKVIQCNIRGITARKHAEEQIRGLNGNLERRVVERSAQLQAANRKLEAFSYPFLTICEPRCAMFWASWNRCNERLDRPFQLVASGI